MPSPSPVAQFTVGTAIPHILEQSGVQVVFGIPGNHTVELYRGLADTSIRHITTRHEQGAAFMADGYARVSGQPGVCFVISGPGLMNAATAIVQAQQDSVPLLVVTTVSGADDQVGALHQMPDQLGAAQGMCKAVMQIESAATLQAQLREAYALCAAASPGAVVVQVPLHLIGDTCALSEVEAETQIESSAAESPGKPGEYAQTIAELLGGAQQPLLLLGGGAQRCTHLVELAERLDAPVLNTVNGKGLLPASHPLAVGGSPSLPTLKRALAAADVVLALGTELGETDFDLLMNETPERRGRWLLVSTAESPPVLADEVFACGVEVLVPALLGALDDMHCDGAERARQLRAEVGQEAHMHPDFAVFFKAVQAAASDLVLVGDSTRPTYYAAWMYECEQPRRYFHSVSGFGTLGYAIPAAFGAALASQVGVVALIGDGGAQFSLAELATGLDNQIGVPIVIWCNRGYEEITNSLAAQGVGGSSTDVSAPDYAQLAKAYGLQCWQPETPVELTQAISAGLKLQQPSLILVQQSKFVHSASGQWYS